MDEGDSATGHHGLPGVDPELAELAYRTLREIAAAYMMRERSDHTLQPTALVSEAYLRLAEAKPGVLGDHDAFVGIAARVMRQVLVDHARAKNAAKRGGGWGRVTLAGMEELVGRADKIDVLALDAALDRLAQHDERLARVVELRFFAGMTADQASACLGVSKRTVESDWSFAKAWLKRDMQGAGE